ncbi:MAG: aspartyl-tRNA synthetase [Patescibacteria group bacterium]
MILLENIMERTMIADLPSQVGNEVKMCGWIDTIRDSGKLIFIDLRDRSGKVQCIIRMANTDFEKVKGLTVESSVAITGEVKERPGGTDNNELGDVGNLEVGITSVEIYSLADLLPFEIKRDDVNEDTRLKHRYLDLRGERLKHNIVMRHKIILHIREFLNKKDFLEIQTPILTKSTPEGARDYIVPSRTNPGSFYALPQSPQQYKQLLMIAGMEKYFQVAPCFRDEDARADRCPGEFYQLDMEMSFMSQNEILDLMEELMKSIVKNLLPEKHFTFEEFPRITYTEAMEKYGNDKPDLRVDKDDPNELAFAWIVDFPLFEEEKTDGNYAPMHHMFTMPQEKDLHLLTIEDAHKVKSHQYDLALNGFEVGGGSIRIHDAKIQKKIFDLIGFSDTQKAEFEHMLTAFKYGVPPHGGIAPGIDRLIMALLGEKNIREVIAFPKNRDARDVTMDAPSPIANEQLTDVHIKLDLPKKEE